MSARLLFSKFGVWPFIAASDRLPLLSAALLPLLATRCGGFPPHEHQQNLLLSRIITNVEKLNEAVMVMNKALQDINVQNMDMELVAQMFKNYRSNVLFHLEATDKLAEPS
ncbi:DASH complex subunit DAD4 [Niveomyces insectorum RCEF 264]|uniref:DASH complex subunit DAD4 n=1 Tax=Niveomyces insectorum RCEF 264 TaxID=1081102 RepID=A0A167MEK3_9HYPO|nr:DASH complex subunit DAD4 [Niveomyces insectorum RCEF 264]